MTFFEILNQTFPYRLPLGIKEKIKQTKEIIKDKVGYRIILNEVIDSVFSSNVIL